MARWVFLAVLLVFAACSQGEVDFDLDGQLAPVPSDGKGDGAGSPAIAIDADVRDTEVWKVRNRWEDVDQTPDARAAGMAWQAGSGLTWDQKYAAWVKSMKHVSQGYGAESYELTTPYGKTLGSPALECAETAMFLRAVFASWYGLPFFMEAWDKQSGRVFFGHFGVRTAEGRWRRSPLFPQYKDYRTTWKPGDAWPRDARLRKVHLDGPLAGADGQPALGDGEAGVGAYLDEILLNKRAGYFVAYLLDYFYSGSLADGVNTYHVKPEAIREGDVVLHRHDKSGIGHTLVVKTVTPFGTDQLLVEMIAGSMPRIQGYWSDEVSSKLELTGDSAGGAGESSDTPPVPMWKLGGGLKRFRVARVNNGSWVNTWMPGDQASFISSADGERVSARPKRFETLLGELPPEQKRDALLKIIEASRLGLSRNPSSCASRTDRENAFEKLYELAYELGTDRLAIDRQYRTLADAVFKQLEYSASKTCCWNHSSASIYRVVMDHAAAEQEAAKAQMMCKEPTVFAANAIVPEGYEGPRDGYQLWRHWAAQQGRAAEWIDSDGKPAAWRRDEPCPGEAVAADSTVDGARSYCEITAPLPVPDMADPPADMGEADLAGEAPADGAVPVDMGSP